MSSKPTAVPVTAVLVGDAFVGKSALAYSFLRNLNRSNYVTIGNKYNTEVSLSIDIHIIFLFFFVV